MRQLKGTLKILHISIQNRYVQTMRAWVYNVSALSQWRSLLKNGNRSENTLVCFYGKWPKGVENCWGCDSRESYFPNTQSVKRCFTWVMAVLLKDRKTAKTASHSMRYLEAHCQICEVFVSKENINLHIVANVSIRLLKKD